ncbi:hypothetical protein BpHYR1_039094 [Brachionus plicatilis]|uniref:Uncharacterized protein n=1 Tax=Brachionus plicatilis TaxID=10195 RepID=A0A3M7RZ40_BRAPC|nr:hypothetical protein BpHYR1_039094 [Brachionus plicatilis]
MAFVSSEGPKHVLALIRTEQNVSTTDTFSVPPLKVELDFFNITITQYLNFADVLQSFAESIDKDYTTTFVHVKIRNLNKYIAKLRQIFQLIG